MFLVLASFVWIIMKEPVGKKLEKSFERKLSERR